MWLNEDYNTYTAEDGQVFAATLGQKLGYPSDVRVCLKGIPSLSSFVLQSYFLPPPSSK